MQTPRMFLAALCLSALAYSQEFRATISGHVFDGSGASVAGAKITAVSKATNETSRATADGSGTYSIPFLRPGEYKVTVTAPGFKTYNREGLTLQVGQIVGMDATLEVGALTESVNVTADAAMLETQSASRIGVVNQMQVAELPLNARNPFMLGTMMSGVVFRGAAIWQRPFDNGAIAQWSVNGGRESNNEFMMDGAPNNAQAGGNNIAYVPIVDAVQEFNVQQNSYDAQYGKTGGGVFNVVLKSGTNTHHITAWEFARRRFLDANTFQGNANPRPAGVKNVDRLAGPVQEKPWDVTGVDRLDEQSYPRLAKARRRVRKVRMRGVVPRPTTPRRRQGRADPIKLGSAWSLPWLEECPR